MVTSAEALELLEGPPACLYRGSRPHGPSRSGLGEFQVEEALRPHLGLGDGFPGEAGAEREEGLLSSGPASTRSPVPRPAQPTMASQSVGRACAGLAQPPFLPRRLWLGVGEATGSTPAQTPLSLQGPSSLPGCPWEAPGGWVTPPSWWSLHPRRSSYAVCPAVSLPLLGLPLLLLRIGPGGSGKPQRTLGPRGR